ncbi:peptidase family C78-domain-containing protein [Lactarius psammicola]|nr:peptidase family C78-domain-containing protein [Lactarius psammicola]
MLAQGSRLDSLPDPSSAKDRSYPSAKDGFWYHSLDSEPPSNYTPGLIPLLKKTLLESVQKGATRRAFLCYEKAVHIYHEIWDAGWGCGYRNYMMLCAALMDQPTQAAYSLLLSAQTPPSVNSLKVLIEEAWRHGFDPEGAEGLKGKLVGRMKWIGTAELYVAFTYRGIPSRLADFDTPHGRVDPLLDWIRRYFDADSRDHQASPQEWWRGATPVVVTDRIPLILQYQGHSRTIVGYEITRDGATNLLAFDPSVLSGPTKSGMPLPLGGHRHRDSSAKRPRASPPRDDNVIVIEDSEPEQGASKVEPQRHDSRQRTKVDKGRVRTGDSREVLDPKKVLKLFRVDEKKLAKRNKYQVLWFPMEDPLTESDKQARREGDK